MNHLLIHINRDFKRRLNKDKGSQVHTTELQSKRNQTVKPRWARQR